MLKTKPARNVPASVVYPLDYVISKLLASIIFAEWQADGLSTLCCFKQF